MNRRAKSYGWFQRGLVWTALSLAGCVLFAEPTASTNADSSSIKPNPKTILVLGDSLSAGLGVEPSQAYPALLQKKIDAEHRHYTVVNAGVSGDTSVNGLARIGWLLKQPVTVLILELGGNDGLRGIPVTETQTNLQAIIDRVKQNNPHAQIVIAGMQMPPNLGPQYTAAFQKIYPALAAKNNAALVPFLLAGVGGHPQLNQADQIHPTAQGQEIVAENVWKVLKPVLEKLNARSH